MYLFTIMHKQLLTYVLAPVFVLSLHLALFFNYYFFIIFYYIISVIKVVYIYYRLYIYQPNFAQ